MMFLKAFLTSAGLLNGLLVQVGQTAPTEGRLVGRQADLEAFIETEESIAFQGILNNLGPDGSKAPGAYPGIVIASPSQVNPPYFFTWSRDAALVFKALVERFLAGESALRPAIENYISSQAFLQGVGNPSGGFESGGMGEAKYYPNMTAYTGDWGRPQRDGPALRATAMVAYSRYLLANNQANLVRDIVWPIVSNDLSYVTQYWNETGFDLWEEINGSSFFTLAAQHRALVEGNALAGSIGESCAHCVSEAPKILCFLQTFWNGNHIVSNINVNNGRNGKDANSVLTSIHVFDPEAGCDDETFQPCSSKALSNHKELRDAFLFYPINNGIQPGKALAVGRYPEDVYQGGHPWYLCTLAMAEQLYQALYQWSQVGSITVDDVNIKFFRDLEANIAPGQYASSDETYRTLTERVKAYADDFVAVMQKYTPGDGALAEQYSKDDGAPLSAVDLTWSYASFLTAIAARNNELPASWGASSANEVPSQCEGGSALGPYVAATNTVWPGRSAPTSAPEVPSPECAVAVTFKSVATTVLGESLYIVGNSEWLGNFEARNAILMSAAEYTAENPQWSLTLQLPAGLDLQYKYLRKGPGDRLVWESDPDRSFAVPEACRTTAERNDTFQ